MSEFIGFQFTKPLNSDLTKRLSAFIDRFDEMVSMRVTLSNTVVLLTFHDGEPDVNKIRKRVLKITRNAGNDLAEESMPS